MMVKADQDYEAGRPPSAALMAAIGALSGEARKAGKLLASEGLKPSSAGTRIRLANGKRTVIDGPFAETKELIGGFAIVQAESAAAALALANDFLDAHIRAGVQDLDMEIRPMFEVGPCGTTAH